MTNVVQYMEVDIMSTVLSVRLTDEEKEILSQASAVYNCGTSSLIKLLAFEKLEDECDLQMIAEYEKEKANGTLETRDISELWDELGL